MNSSVVHWPSVALVAESKKALNWLEGVGVAQQKEDKVVKNNATVHDVAKTAGVSVGTVSRVLNGYSNVSEENLRRVKDAMKELGYSGTARASSSAAADADSKNNKTGNIGLYIPDMSDKWAGHSLVNEYVNGIEDACAESKYHVLLEFAEDRKGGLPRFVKEGKVDGLLVKGQVFSKALLLEMIAKYPVVGIDMNDPTLDIPQIIKDDHLAGYEMGEYLWNMGHRHIAYLSQNLLHVPFIHRRQGLEEFVILKSSGAQKLVVREEVMDPALRLGPEQALPDALDLVKGLFKKKAQAPTAIVCCNDWLAAGVCKALNTLGLSVGQDISVVGFDNHAVCTYVEPMLTTYEIPFRKIAYVATRLLLDILATSKFSVGSGIRPVNGRIVERGSVLPV